MKLPVDTIEIKELLHTHRAENDFGNPADALGTGDKKSQLFSGDSKGGNNNYWTV